MLGVAFYCSAYISVGYCLGLKPFGHGHLIYTHLRCCQRDKLREFTFDWSLPHRLYMCKLLMCNVQLWQFWFPVECNVAVKTHVNIINHKSISLNYDLIHVYIYTPMQETLSRLPAILNSCQVLADGYCPVALICRPPFFIWIGCSNCSQPMLN